jgi:hypothetical protein
MHSVAVLHGMMAHDVAEHYFKPNTQLHMN